MPSEFLQRTCLLGDDATVAAGLRRLAAAGVRSVNINPVGLPLADQIEALRNVVVLARREALVS